ncbi:hypothetical protein NGB36_26215 [Streptomyces sp. RB6PN25]|uniref:Uncharacterized protein n=1 Tax=Streptomyces humicola TaxID=2953240 RepID=A0ABT1Q226_9ACTN|nr:hypothetical protein [Streptomyces humicola]MCQ4083986.1 hypothetical protein [Streptomyces humicola]
MTVDESLDRYGLRPAGALLDEVRELLDAETRKERRQQGLGDTELMRLSCFQLFNTGALSDVLTIWRAKTSSWDADCSIDVQLLCGAGLAGTKAFLCRHPASEQAQAALQRLLGCEAAGDFEGFSVVRRAAEYATYYVDGDR